MKISAIVTSGGAAAKIALSGVKAVVLRTGLVVAAKSTQLPAWYDIVLVSDAVGISVTGGQQDEVAVGEEFLLSAARIISETVSVVESAPFSVASAVAEIVSVAEAAGFDMSLATSEIVVVSEEFVLGSGRDIAESVSVSESFSTTGDYTLTVAEEVLVTELAVAMIPRGEKYINGSPINATTLG